MNIFGNALNGWHLILILSVIVLLFGATKLPSLAKSVGESIRILRSETKSVGQSAPREEVGSSEQHETSAAASTVSAADGGPQRA